LAVCSSATRTADVVSDVISHDAATMCIQDPMFEASDAIHNARNTGVASGAQLELVPEPPAVTVVALIAMPVRSARTSSRA
jgi:hypothetical protein